MRGLEKLGQIDHSFSWTDFLWQVDIVTVFATFAAAGFGAWAAFGLEEKRRQRERTAAQVAGGNHLLFDLSIIHNDLAQFKKEVIDELPSQDPKHTWYLMKAIVSPLSADNLLENEQLQFLVDLGRADIAMDLTIERQRFVLFIAQVDERSRILREYVRPSWEAAGFTHGTVPPESDLRDATGINRYSEMVDLTANILSFIEQDIVSVRSSFEKLREYLTSEFPEGKFVDVRVDAEDDNAANR